MLELEAQKSRNDILNASLWPETMSENENLGEVKVKKPLMPLWALISHEKWSYTVGTGVQMDRDVEFVKTVFCQKCFFYLPWSADNLSWPGLKFQMGFI